MPFGVVSGVGRGIGVLDGVHVPQEGEVSGVSRCRWFEWRIFEQKYIRLVRDRLIIFPYGQYIGKRLFIGFPKI